MGHCVVMGERYTFKPREKPCETLILYRMAKNVVNHINLKPSRKRNVFSVSCNKCNIPTIRGNITSFPTDDNTRIFCEQCRSRSDCTEHAV